VLQTLLWYALDDHVFSDQPFPRETAWGKPDIVVTIWIYDTLTMELQDIIHMCCVCLTAW
jgi:hypothetical protein